MFGILIETFCPPTNLNSSGVSINFLSSSVKSIFNLQHCETENAFLSNIKYGQPFLLEDSHATINKAFVFGSVKHSSLMCKFILGNANGIPSASPSPTTSKIALANNLASVS